MGNMSDQDYVAHLGKVCPNCSKDSIQLDARFMRRTEYEPEMTFPCYCMNCFYSWIEHYALTGYTGLKPQER